MLLGQISPLLALGSYSSWLIDCILLPQHRCICNTDGARSTLLSQPDLAAVSFPLSRKLTLWVVLHPTNSTCDAHCAAQSCKCPDSSRLGVQQVLLLLQLPKNAKKNHQTQNNNPTNQIVPSAILSFLTVKHWWG